MSVRPSLPPSVRARQSLSPRGLKTFKARSSGTAAPTTMTLGMHICGSENKASVKQNFKFRHMRCTGMPIIFIMSWDFQNPKAPAALSRRRWRIFYEFGDTTSTKKNFQFRRSTAPRAPPTTHTGQLSSISYTALWSCRKAASEASRYTVFYVRQITAKKLTQGNQASHQSS